MGSLLVVEVTIKVQVRLSKEESEGMQDEETESEDDTNDHVPDDPVGGSHGVWGPKDSHYLRIWRILGTSGFCFMNVHAKWPIFLAKDDEDAESNLLHCNYWMNSQGTTEDAKCIDFVWY